jgi:iron complex transport system substrate-binding protein
MPRSHRNPANFAIFLSVVSGLLFTACSRPPDGSRKPGSAKDTAECVDGIGRRIALPRHPSRIVSLAPSVTEVLYLVGSNDRLIGVTTQCDWPEDARQKPKIGSLLNPNYELILASRPDLVIASTAGNDKAAVLKLAALGLPVYVTAPRSVDGIFETTLAIARITDRAAEGERLLAEMKTRLLEIRRRIAGLPPVRAFFITWFDPLLAPGGKTFENDVLGLTNVISISAQSEEFYPRYSLEQVLAQNPEVILTVSHPGKPLPDLRAIPGWKTLEAVKKGRVYLLLDVLQHPSPRFVDAVEDMARRLYPERFR